MSRSVGRNSFGLSRPFTANGSSCNHTHNWFSTLVKEHRPLASHTLTQHSFRFFSQDQSDKDRSQPKQNATDTTLSDEWDAKWERGTMDQRLELCLRAARAGQWELLEGQATQIIELRNAQNQSFLTALIATCTPETARACMRQAVSDLFPSEQLAEAMNIAVDRGDVRLILEMLKGCDINGRDKGGLTPLFIAIGRDNRQAVSTLIHNGAETDLTCPVQIELPAKEFVKSDGTPLLTPLAYAVKHGSYRAIDSLLESKGPALLEAAVVPDVGNVLHLAILAGQTGIMTYLLTRNPEVCKKMLEDDSGLGCTPLSLAASMGETQAALILHAHGVSMNGKDSQGRRAIDWAIKSGQEDMVLLLNQLGADLAAINCDAAPTAKLRNFFNNLQRRQLQAKRHAPTFEGLSAVNLAIQGGGIKGIAHIGALRVMQGEKILERVHRVAGTSAGAIVSALIATGHRVEEIEQHLRGMDLPALLNLHSQGLTALVTESSKLTSGIATIRHFLSAPSLTAEALATLIKEPGLTDTSAVAGWVADRIKDKSEIDDLTFGELRNFVEKGTPGFRHLTVFATQIRPELRLCAMSSEKSLEQNNEWDDVCISTAVAASAAIPVLFCPAQLRFKRQGDTYDDKRFFVDGGLIKNLPIETWDYKRYTQENCPPDLLNESEQNRNTIGLSIYHRSENPSSGLRSAKDVVSAVLRVYLEVESLLRGNTDNSRTIRIDPGELGTIEVSLSAQQQTDLIEQGTTAAAAFFGSRRPSTGSAFHAPSLKLSSNLRFPKTALYPLDALLARAKQDLSNFLNSFSSQPAWQGSLPALVYTIRGRPGTETNKLAALLAHDLQSAVSFTFWIDSGATGQREKSYEQLAEQLGIPWSGPDREEVLFRSLESYPFSKPWLLVLANLDDHIALPRYGGIVLKTSQYSSSSKHSILVPSVWEYRQLVREHVRAAPEEPISFIPPEKEELLYAVQTAAWKSFFSKANEQLPGFVDLVMFLSLGAHSGWSWNDLYGWMQKALSSATKSEVDDRLRQSIDLITNMGLVDQVDKRLKLANIIDPATLAQLLPVEQEHVNEAVAHIAHRIPQASDWNLEQVSDKLDQFISASEKLSVLLESKHWWIDSQQQIELRFRLGNLYHQLFGYERAQPHFFQAFDLLTRLHSNSASGSRGSAVAFWNGLNQFIHGLAQVTGLANFFSEELSKIADTKWFAGYSYDNSRLFVQALDGVLANKDPFRKEVAYLKAVAEFLSMPDSIVLPHWKYQKRSEVFHKASMLDSVEIYSLKRLLTCTTEQLESILIEELKDGKKSHHYSYLVSAIKIGALAENLAQDVLSYGSSVSQYNLGLCYDNGWGVSKSLIKATMLYKRAAEQGNARAQLNLALCYERGDGVEKSVDEAVRLYKLAAEQGEAGAQLNLALSYQRGDGVEKYLGEAVRLYKLAAEQGNARAQFNLAVCYQIGNEVEKSVDEAVRLYKLAAEQGEAGAQANLGVCYQRGEGVEKNLGEAVRLYKLAADMGDARAQFNLGVCYQLGEGVEKDFGEAVRLYKLAAEREAAGAQFNLGVCYQRGEGVEKDLGEAVRLYKLAAEQGNARAQVMLALCYQHGEGVAKDVGEAARLCKLAAEQGDAKAQFSLGMCYQDGDGVEKDVGEAAGLYKLAAEQGDASAQVKLGVCYQHGQGLVKDSQEAVRWYKLAASQGNIYGKLFLGLCQLLGQGIAKNVEMGTDILKQVVLEEPNIVQQLQHSAEIDSDALVSFAVGACYRYGIGADRDYLRANRYFINAHKLGCEGVEAFLH